MAGNHAHIDSQHLHLHLKPWKILREFGVDSVLNLLNLFVTRNGWIGYANNKLQFGFGAGAPVIGPIEVDAFHLQCFIGSEGQCAAVEVRPDFSFDSALGSLSLDVVEVLLVVTTKQIFTDENQQTYRQQNRQPGTSTSTQLVLKIGFTGRQDDQPADQNSQKVGEIKKA